MSIWAVVKRIQITENGVTYKPGDWIEFTPDRLGRAMRLAAGNIIELHDYYDVMPDGVTIEILQSDGHEDWAKRLNIQSSSNAAWKIKSDFGLSITAKNPYIVKNSAAFAAMVSNGNYDFFCAIRSYTMNLNQMNMSAENKETVQDLLPDLRIPCYSADWILWRNKKAAKDTMKRMNQLYRENQLVPDIALTVALYETKPLLWIVPVEWI